MDGSRHALARLALATLLGGAGAAAVAAQQATPPVITFEQAIRIALAQGLDVQRAQNAVTAEESAVLRQQLAFLPDLRFSTQAGSSVGRAFSQDEGAIITQTMSSLNAGLSSSVTLFDGFRSMASLKSAQLGRSASADDLERVRETTVMTVAQNFLALLAATELIRVRQQALAAQEEELAQIRAFVAAGKRPLADLYQQQAAMAAASAALVDADRSRGAARIDIIATLQLDPALDFDFRAPALADDAATAAPAPLDSLVARALASRADLDASRARLAAAEQSVRAAAASRWPTISLSAAYSTAATSASSLGLRDQLDERQAGSLSLGLSIPLFDRLATRTATEQAKVQADNARLDVQRQRQEIALEVRRAWNDRDAAEARLRAAEAQLEAAERALQAVAERYRVGAATLLEVTQARAAQVEAASARVNARYTLHLQRALLDYYVGDLDPAALTLLGAP